MSAGVPPFVPPGTRRALQAVLVAGTATAFVSFAVDTTMWIVAAGFLLLVPTAWRVARLPMWLLVVMEALFVVLLASLHFRCSTAADCDHDTIFLMLSTSWQFGLLGLVVAYLAELEPVSIDANRPRWVRLSARIGLRTIMTFALAAIFGFGSLFIAVFALEGDLRPFGMLVWAAPVGLAALTSYWLRSPAPALLAIAIALAMNAGAEERCEAIEHDAGDEHDCGLSALTDPGVYPYLHGSLAAAVVVAALVGWRVGVHRSRRGQGVPAAP